MKTRSKRQRAAAAALALTAAIAAAAIAPAAGAGQPAQAQSPTVTPTPTRRAGGAARLLLKGVNKNSPDGVGTIPAQVRLQDDGAWSANTFEWLPAPETIELARDTPDGRLRAEFTFFEVTPEGPVEVYRHTERNAPFCAFGDANGRCRSMPIVNGEYRWPDSDDDPGSGSPVKPGRYALEINAFAYIQGEDANTFGNCSISAGFDIEFAEAGAPAALPRQTGRAAIVAPSDGSVLKGVVDVRGTATSNNFAFFKFEFEDARCANGVCFVADSRRQVNNGTLLRWDTRTVPNGDYVLRLVVVDRFGRELGQIPRIRISVQN